MDEKKFKRWNLLTAAAVFIVSTFTYLSTLEPTASFWDCGEFIASSYKLEVGHPPGNPVFQLIARFLTMFTGPSKAAVMVNSMSALCSALTIFFLFLTIVFLVKRVIRPSIGDNGAPVYSTGQAVAILGSGAVGALAYCFSDTFWFSAVEGEVYAMSSLFTALVVWAMTKWYEAEDRRYANRWIVLISFLMGLSIGIHLLNLLAIPILVFMFYYKKREDKPFTLWESVKILLLSAAIIAFVLFLMIPLIPKIAAYFDLFFVNVLASGAFSRLWPRVRYFGTLHCCASRPLSSGSPSSVSSSSVPVRKLLPTSISLTMPLLWYVTFPVSSTVQPRCFMVSISDLRIP